MKKYITFLLLFTFLFTACAERGQTLSPNNLTLICTQKATSTVTEKKKVKEINTVKKEAFTENNITSDINKTASYLEKNTINIQNNKQKGFFTLTEETKNKISGFFIAAIGVMIFL